MARRDVIGVVEAAYDIQKNDAGWLEGLGRAVSPLVDRGLGVVAQYYDIRSPTSMKTWGVRSVGADPRFAKRLPRFNAEAPPAALDRSYRLGSLCGTASELVGAEIHTHPAWRRYLHPLGIRDCFGINALGFDGIGCMIAVPLGSPGATDRADRRRWDRVAAHMGAGLRLRHALARLGAAHGTVDGADAILEPGGKLAHAAVPEASSRRGRESLRTAVRVVDRARGALRGRDPDEALEIWQGLVAGRWSLVDHFDSDGRRFVLARRNDPDVADPRALTPRERQVLRFAALGHAHKLIAYELGLSISTVATHLARAQRKLGVRNRAALVALFATFGSPTSTSTDPAGRKDHY
jgi:DNA-binding NarL/FixJ family response regulator